MGNALPVSTIWQARNVAALRRPLDHIEIRQGCIGRRHCEAFAPIGR
jgi:hypothetical protein